MDLPRCYRAKNGKRHAYWALVRSERTARGPRQKVVAYLGEMDAQGRLAVRNAAKGQTGDAQGQLFESPAKPQWFRVDAQNIRVENCRAFGRVA